MDAAAIWQHKGSHHWHAFSAETNALVDKAFQNGELMITYQVNNRFYTIDLRKSEQFQVDDPLKTREVRRIDPVMPGIVPTSTLGKWQHADVQCPDCWEDFPHDLNTLVDKAFFGGASGHRFTMKGVEYVINFQDMKQSCVVGSKVRIVRRTGGSNFSSFHVNAMHWPNGEPLGFEKVPMLWHAMGQSTYLEVELLGVPSLALECERVTNYFKKRLQNNFPIVSIKRLQNIALWQKYVQHRECIMHKSYNMGIANEEYFWHGSKGNADEAIKREGFDVSKGNGVTWLSTNSKYSADYCLHGQMFLVRATLGSIGLDCTHCGGTGSGHSRKDDEVGCGRDNRYTFANNSQMYPAYIIRFSRA